MIRDFSGVTTEQFDLVIIGGGIIGAGIARDASMRGIKTLLLEKEDFACGTTSRSSRLIHGGLRYLRQLEFGLVRQDVREREVLLHIAPHLVHPLPFVIPITRKIDRFSLPFGMLLYDIMSYDKSLPSCHRLSRRETLDREPGLESQGLAGSYLYHDCSAPFVERLCLENILSAIDHHAIALNHAKATGLLKSGSGVYGVQIKDSITGDRYEAKARIVLNAAGHWVDSIMNMFGSNQRKRIRRTKGVHMLAPKLSNDAVVCFSQADGRLLFIIPWQSFSLIGTTDTDYFGNLDNIYADKEDVEYLFSEVRRAFPHLKLEDIYYTSAGLRSLATDGSKKASDISRAHKLVDHKQEDGIEGFISVLGGKITGYRAIAQEAVDLVSKKLGVKTPCHTASIPLPGAPAVALTEIAKIAERSNISDITLSHLAELYGSRMSQIMQIMRSDSSSEQQICPHCHDVIAQIEYSVTEEGACTISDFMLRRTGIGLNPCQGLDAVETVAKKMSGLLGWNINEQQQQIERYRERVALSQRYKNQQ
jgi:glycerol-3-phosphate dehydrogenase